MTDSNVFLIHSGGSGYGGTYWESWGTDCLVMKDFEISSPLPNKHHDYNDIGLAVHGYLERYYKYGHTHRLQFEFDDDWQLTPELDQQAWDMFQGYIESDIIQNIGEVLGVEEQLEGELFEGSFGIAPFTGRIDLRVRRPDGIYIIDWKTCSSWSADPEDDLHKYGYGSYKTARIRYCHGANVLGLGPITGMIFIQIKKTKTPQFRELPPVPLRLEEVVAYKRYLQFCKDRKENYPREFMFKQCAYCRYQKMCSKGAY